MLSRVAAGLALAGVVVSASAITPILFSGGATVQNTVSATKANNAVNDKRQTKGKMPHQQEGIGLKLPQANPWPSRLDDPIYSGREKLQVKPK